MTDPATTAASWRARASDIRTSAAKAVDQALGVFPGARERARRGGTAIDRLLDRALQRIRGTQ